MGKVLKFERPSPKTNEPSSDRQSPAAPPDAFMPPEVREGINRARKILADAEYLDSIGY